MAFNINAQVILSGPKNIQKVRSSISKQLSGVTVDVNLKVPKNAAADLGKLNSSLNTLNATLSTLNKNATSARTALDSLTKAGKNLGNFSKNLSSQNQKATKSLDAVGSSAAKAGSQLEEFGKDAALAVRRFSAFTIATGAVFGLVRAVSNATGESIKFERELARVVQVTGATDKQLKGLTRTIDNLSTSLGLDANKLLEVSVTFAQTGQSIDQVAKSLKAVSRASLAATFGDIQKTTEGVVAALAQFNLSAGRAESVLGSLNAVSKSFAVEADDLISVIRRAGGVFSASSVQLGAPEERLRELIGVFTAVRSTTRESADTIATGLRTIFTRIQRPQTIKFLEQFGVQLRATAADAKKFGLAEGDFVGIFESLKRISAEIGGLDTLQLAKVVEELGGVRQVGKLLPALREFEKAERARAVALAGTESISKDVAIATKTLAVQIENLQQRFGKLIRDVSQSDTFQNIAKFAISAANAILTLTDALRPALPLLTAFAGIKLAGAAFDFSKGFVGGLKKGGGAGGVGQAVGNLATAGGEAGKKNAAAKQASDKQVIAALSKNTIATDKNTQALTSMSTGLTTLNATQSTLVTSANALSTQSTQLIAALNKLPAILLRGSGGGAAPLPIRRGPRRRANGGVIPKFAKGGFVNGPSHAQGGVIAELEGGEFVVPKKDAKRQGLQRGGVSLPSARNTRASTEKLEDKSSDARKFAKKDAKAKGAFTSDTVQSLNTALNSPETAGLFILQKEGGKQKLTGGSEASFVGSSAGLTIGGRDSDFVDKIFNKYEAFYRAGYESSLTPAKLAKNPSTDANIKKALKLNRVAGEFPLLTLQSTRAIGEDPQIKTLFSESAKEALTVGVEKIYASDLIEKISPNVGPLKLTDGKNFKLDNLFDGSLETIEGYLLEGLVAGLADIPLAGGQSDIDFPKIDAEAQKRMQNLFGDAALGVSLGDGKRTAAGNESALQAKLKADFVKRSGSLADFKPFGQQGQLAATGGRIGFQNGGMVPVAISNGEGLVDAATASRIMPLLERARAGDGSAIQALAKERGIIQDIVGPGSGTSDSIKTNLAAGSFVLQKSIMDRIDGQRQNAATGGVVRGRLQKGGIAGLATGAIGLTAAATSIGSGDITSAIFSIALFKDELLNLKDSFKETSKSVKGLAKNLSPTARAAKAAKRAARSLPGAQGPADPRRRFQTQLGRNASTSASSGARPIFLAGDKARASKLASSRADRISKIQAAGKGNLLQSSIKTSNIAAFAKRAKFSIGGIVASLLVEPLLDGVEKSLIGAKQRIGEFEGFTKEQGGLATAKAVGGTRGAITGALTGASLGAFAGPVGAAIGAAAGAALGAAIGIGKSGREQRRFDVLQNTQNIGTGLSQSLEALARSGASNTEALNRTTKALLDFTSQISINIREFAGVSGDDFNTRLSERDIEPIKAIGPGRPDQDFSGRAFRANRKNILKDVNAISAVLDTIPDKLFEDAEKSRQKIQNDLFNSLGLDDLGVLSNLSSDADFDDLSTALKSVSDGSELFAERLKNLQAAQLVQIRQLQKEQKTRLLAVAGDNERKIALAGSAITASEVFASEFAKSGSIKSAAKASNKQFAEELVRNTQGGEQTFKDLFNRGGSQSDGGLAKFNKEVEKSLEFGKLTPRLRQLALNSGYSETELFSLIQTQDLFIENTSRSSAAALKAAADQRLLEESIRNTAQGVDLLVTALSRLGSGVDNAVANFENSASNVKNNVSQILSTQQTVSPVAKGNIFNDPLATQKQIEAGIVRVQSATGGNLGDAEGLAATISITDQLPGAVKNVVDDLTKSGKEITGGQFADKITSQITGFDKIPDFIQDKLKEQLEQTFQGLSRQDTQKGGVEAVKRFAQEGGIEKLSEISNKTRETFSKLNETVTKFDALILDSANLQVQSTRQLVDAQLKAADKTNAFADRLDKFRGGTGKDPLAQATQRLDQKVSILLNKGGVQTNDGGDLLKRRSELEGNISFLKDAIGQTTGTDKFDTASLAAFDDPQTKVLINELANTTSALEGTKQAIDLLANDTTELAAVEGKLAAINESRLTGRQRLTALFSQLANAKNPFDRQKILNDFQRPLVAAAKAQQGIPLSFQEFAALQSDVLQGVNGLLGTVEKNLFGRSDEDILGRFETLLVNNQKTGISALQALGLTAAPAIFGGAAATAQGQTPEEQKLLSTADALLKRSVDLVNGVAQANADAIANQQQILQTELITTKSVLQDLNAEFGKLRNTIIALNPPDAAPATPPPVNKAKGGVVYRANGGAASPFDAYKKGTDDVPAMLTEGEFVMQKSAVDRIGVGNLNMLNNLSGPKRDRVLYAQDGGLVGSGIDFLQGDGATDIGASIGKTIAKAIESEADKFSGVTPKVEKLAQALIKAERDFGVGSKEFNLARADFEANFQEKKGVLQKTIESTSSFLKGEQDDSSLAKARKITSRVGARASNRNESLNPEFELKGRGVNEKDFASKLDRASGLNSLRRSLDKSKEAREQETLPDSFFPLRQKFIESNKNVVRSAGLSQRDEFGNRTIADTGLGALVPKTGDTFRGKTLGSVARDPQRLTDDERENARRFEREEAEKKERNIFAERQAKAQVGRDAREKASSSLGGGLSSNRKRVGVLDARREDVLSNDFGGVDKLERKFRELEKQVLEETKRVTDSGGIASSFVSGSGGQELTKLGQLRNDRDEAFKKFRERRLEVDDALFPNLPNGARNPLKPRDLFSERPTIREENIPEKSQAAKDTAKNQKIQDDFIGDVFNAAKQKTADDAAKQQAAKDTRGLPQTAEGNAFVPDVNEKGQAVSNTELTPEEQKIVTRYLQDQEKKTGKTAGKLGLRGKNDLGNLGVSADGSKDAAVDKFVRDRNLGAGGVDGKGFRKGSQPDPAKLAERDAAVLGTTKKDTTSPDKFPIAGEAGGTAAPSAPSAPSAFDRSESTLPQPFLGGSSVTSLTPTQRIRATRRTSNRRGYVPRRGFYAQRAINARQQRYARSGAPGLGSARENFFQNAIQNGGQESLGPQNAPQQTGPNYRKPPAGAAPTAGAMQIQGAAELNQSLTQMTTVSQQLLAAATKLENLPALEITINGKIAPVEVILNGTQMLANFKASFQNDIMQAVADEIARQKLALDK